MPGSAFLIFAVLFENRLVNSAFYITFEHIPILSGHHIDYLFEVNGGLNFISCFRKNSADKSRFAGEFFERRFILLDKICAA